MKGINMSVVNSKPSRIISSEETLADVEPMYDFDELKAFEIIGVVVIAEDKEEALHMYKEYKKDDMQLFNMLIDDGYYELDLVRDYECKDKSSLVKKQVIEFKNTISNYNIEDTTKCLIEAMQLYGMTADETCKRLDTANKLLKECKNEI